MYDAMVISVKINAEIICKVLYYVGWLPQCFINKPMKAIRPGLESYRTLFLHNWIKKFRMLKLKGTIFFSDGNKHGKYKFEKVMKMCIVG